MDSRRETVKSCGVCEFASCDTITPLFAPCSASVAANIFFLPCYLPAQFPSRRRDNQCDSIVKFCAFLSRGVFNFLTHPSRVFISSTRASSQFRGTAGISPARWNINTLVQLYSNYNNLKLYFYYCHFIIGTKLHCTTLLKRNVIRLETKLRPDSRFNFTRHDYSAGISKYQPET